VRVPQEVDTSINHESWAEEKSFRDSLSGDLADSKNGK
jgi:hypothetical protein